MGSGRAGKDFFWKRFIGGCMIMRFMLVTLALGTLLGSMALVPTASAAPPCWYDPDRVGCLLEYAHEEVIDPAYEEVQAIWQDFWNSLPYCVKYPLDPICWT